MTGYKQDKSKWIMYNRNIPHPNSEFEPPLGTEQVLESVNCVCHPRREGLFCQSKIINADCRFGTDTGYYIEDEDDNIIKEFYSNEPLFFDSVKDAVTYLEDEYTYQIGFDVRTKTHRHLLTEAFYI